MNHPLIELVGWISVNIFVPVLLPFVILLLPKVLKKTRPYSKGLVLKAVQDGQLFWVTTALCAVGIYDLYLYTRVEAAGSANTSAFIGIFLFAVFALISIVFVVLQALDIPNPPPAAQQQPEQPAPVPLAPDKALVTLSVVFVLLAAVTTSGAHHLAATATDDAILAKEAKWQCIVKCLKVGKSDETCQCKGVIK